ncbi:N-acyl homoserine lactonase family protein [Castellaniella sp.]|uniref:N-acyl homoserine lactonase family protein n=1 Tax=Castellaniella sp. TaxID=1955812 RepID=UPI003561E2C6
MIQRTLPEFEVFAIRYAHVLRHARENFLQGDIHDGMMDLDFYFWLVRNDQKCVLVDTGFSACSARQRKRQYLCEPLQALAQLQVKPEMVSELILTHLHYDHAGNVDSFPNARVHLQDTEMNYATGRYMRHVALSHFFSVDDVITVLRRVFADEVCFHDGHGVVTPGIELFRVGGHTAGLQIVRIHTRRGWVVLASNAMHYYRNHDEANPFPAIFNVGEMLEGYRLIDTLAETPAHVVPGHDPEVARRYPRLPGTEVEIYQLHESPREPA